MERVKVGQKEFDKVNINDRVGFRLTGYGQLIYRLWVDAVFPGSRKEFMEIKEKLLDEIKPKENGMSELMLWKVMSAFGDKMDPVHEIFENNELFFVRD